MDPLNFIQRILLAPAIEEADGKSPSVRIFQTLPYVGWKPGIDRTQLLKVEIQRSENSQIRVRSRELVRNAG